MTELLAGLLVASMLVVGLAEIARRYSFTAVRTKAVIADVRATQTLDVLMSALERVEPGTLEVSPDRLRARIGSKEIRATLGLPANGVRKLEWTMPDITRTLALPATSHFELTSSGVVLLTEDGKPPLALARPARTASFDCQFDVVIRDCR